MSTLPVNIRPACVSYWARSQCYVQQRQLSLPVFSSYYTCSEYTTLQRLFSTRQSTTAYYSPHFCRYLQFSVLPFLPSDDTIYRERFVLLFYASFWPMTRLAKLKKVSLFFNFNFNFSISIYFHNYRIFNNIIFVSIGQRCDG